MRMLRVQLAQGGLSPPLAFALDSYLFHVRPDGLWFGLFETCHQDFLMTAGMTERMTILATTYEKLFFTGS